MRIRGRARVKAIAPATVRGFCLDEASREWQIVPRSGADAPGTYAWVHLHRSGLHVAIGLQAGAEALRTVLTLRTLMPQLRAAGGGQRRRSALAAIQGLLRPAPGAAGSARRGLDIASIDLASTFGRGAYQLALS